MRLVSLTTAAELYGENGDMGNCARLLRQIEEYSLLREDIIHLQLKCYDPQEDSELLSRAREKLRLLDAHKPDHLVDW